MYSEQDIRAAQIFYKIPALLNPVRESLADIFDVIREYIPRRKYDVTRYGYLAVAATVNEYFTAKRISTEYANIVSSESDSFLSYIYEELSALSKITINARDLEGTLEILRCYRDIAKRSITLPTLINNDSDNYTCGMASGYLTQVVIDAVHAGLDDAGLEGVRMLRDIEAGLPSAHYFTTLSICEDIYKIAFAGLTKFYLVDGATSALVSIYGTRGISTGSYVLGKQVLEKIKKISLLYMRIHPNIGFNCEGLSSVFSVSKEKTLPFLIIEKLPEILESGSDHVTKELFLMYEEVGRQAATQDSFLVYFIVESVNAIVSAAVEEIAKVEDAPKRKRLMQNFNWLLTVYWRMYDSQPDESKSNHITMTAIDRVTALAMRALSLNAEDLAIQINEQLISIVHVGLGKTPDEFTVPRLLVYEVKLGAVARANGKNILADLCLKEVVSNFATYREKWLSEIETANGPDAAKKEFKRRGEEVLSTEMWRLYIDFPNRSEMPISPFESDRYFYSMLTLDQLKSYLNEIELKVYNRTIEDIQTRRHF